jgi:hypothetical protein
MTVKLTSSVEGKQPGADFTGSAGREAWLLASGYASKAGYTGPGVANTGPTDVGPDGNPEFDDVRGPIATGSDLPQGGTNDGITTAAAPAPSHSVT